MAPSYITFTGGGAPAQAGIDLHEEGKSGGGLGCPRASGDRPVTLGAVAVSLWVPPRKRG